MKDVFVLQYPEDTSRQDTTNFPHPNKPDIAYGGVRGHWEQVMFKDERQLLLYGKDGGIICVVFEMSHYNAVAQRSWVE